MHLRKTYSEKGMTLLEIIIVIALMAGMMVYALPNLNSAANDYITKVNLFAATVKNAFDTTVLTGKPHRIVIEFSSGDYWLESTLDTEYKISMDKSGRDLNAEQQKYYREEFESNFQDYVDLAGSAVTDVDSGNEIQPESPVVKAKKKLMEPRWFQVESVEWGKSNIGPNLMFSTTQAEHHGDPIKGLEEEPGSVAHIYISPAGYIEKAYIVVVPVDQDMQPIDEEEPFTIETFSYDGTAQIHDGIIDFKFEDR